MVFNDVYVGIYKQRECILKLREMTIAFESILLKERKWKSKFFEISYSRSLTKESKDTCATLSRRLEGDTIMYFNDIRTKLISIDFWNFSSILNDYRNLKIKGVESISEDIYNNIVRSYRNIHRYMMIDNIEDRIKEYEGLIQSIQNIVFELRKNEYLFKVIKAVDISLCHGEEANFSIQLLGDDFNKEDYNNVLNPMCELYNKICEISNIKEELKIVRIESGSFLAKFKGDSRVLNFIDRFINDVYDILMKRFTKDGKKQSLVESIDLVSKEIDMLKNMQDLGIDVDKEKEISRETMGLLVKQVHLLISSSPEIKVNDKVLDKSETLKKQLQHLNYKLISEETLNNTEVCVDSNNLERE